jgi:hypothetical protein
LTSSPRNNILPGTTKRQMTWVKSFREAFCERFACPPEEFEKRVLRRALYRRSRPLSALLYSWNPRFFDLDLRTIRQLGLARSSEEFRAEIDSFRFESRMQRGFLKRTLRLRISGKRLMRLLEEVAPARE